MTHRIHLKHIAIATGIGIVLLGLTVLTHALLTPLVHDKPVRVNTQKSKPTKRAIGYLQIPASPSQTDDFQDSDFYRTIIDNNLFRPLGWRPPRPREPYRLIGTIIPTDGITDARAILQTTRGNTIHTVRQGDTLDVDTTVIDIQSKQITLEKAGQQRTLKFNRTPWIKWEAAVSTFILDLDFGRTYWEKNLKVFSAFTQNLCLLW